MSSLVAVYAIQPFVPNEGALYNLDEAAHLARLPRHFVVVCWKHGLITPQVDSAYGGLFFDVPAIQRLQQIGYLHGECRVNFTGIKIILELMEEVERLRGAPATARSVSM